MGSFKINKQGIRKMKKDIEKEFNKGGGTRIGLITGDGSGSSGWGDGGMDGSASGNPDENGMLYWTACAVLELLDDQVDQRRGRRESSSEICASVFPERDRNGDNQRFVERALDLLQAQRLVKVSGTMQDDYSACWIEDEGRVHMTNVRERRARPSVRSAAAKRSILRWLGEVGRGTTDEMPLVYRHIDGSELEQLELDAAIKELKDKGLIALGTGMQLTENGRRCMESYGGNVSRYEAEAEKFRPSYTNIFHGSIGSQQIAQGDYATLSQDNRQHVLQEVRGLIRQTREVQDHLELERTDAQVLERILSDLETETNKETPNQTKLRSTLEWGQETLSKAASSATASAFSPFLVAAFERVAQMM